MSLGQPVALGEIATIIAGQSPPGSTYNENGLGMPFFQGKADFGDAHPIAKKWCTEPRKIAEAGDILISVRAPVGPTNVASVRCCIGRGLAAIRPDESTATRDFVLWAIKQREPALVAKAQGSTFPAIGQKDLKSLSVPLPPLDEQRRIVAILNRAAKIERLRARAAERMRQFVPALFVRMFGDPVENPMGWKSQRLGEVCVSARYGTSKKASVTRISGVPVIRMGNVTYDGDLDCADLKYVWLSDVELEKHALRFGDILFNRTNSRELVGKTGIWDGRYEAVAASYFIRLRLDAVQIHPTYVWGFFNAAGTKRVLYGMARGAIGQANINAKEVQSLVLPVPPVELQRRFAEIVENAQVSRDISETCITGASALTQSLMGHLLSVNREGWDA